ncbi:hypothetical protein GCM10020001_110830 [Nonomuraea salmonea]
MLSAGTHVEMLAPAEPAQDGVLTGMSGAAGQATGGARVIREPAGGESLTGQWRRHP